MKNTLLFIFSLLLSTLFYAQIPTIEVPAKNGNYKTTNDVVLQKLSYEIQITGNISTTIATMVFKNNTNRILEGRLTFPLPENVSVSGYALDINGKLRNAVPVEKEKAKEVFESIEKRRVDPGILEKVEGNNFRTLIYPIPVNGERIVQITYNQELKNDGENLQYFIPLDYKDVIPFFSLKTSVFENLNTPKLEEKPDGSFDFVKKGNVWVAETNKRDYKPKGNLKINLPKSSNENSSIMQAAGGKSYYFLANISVNAASKQKVMPQKIGIIWDNSLSGLQRDHAKEFELLDEYFKNVKNIAVKVYFINNEFEEGKNFNISNENWQELKTYLTNVTYDGGTDFGKLQNVKVDEYFLFSDGLSTFGDLNLNLNKPVYSIISSSKANFSQMKFISLKTGGEFLNLNQNSALQEVKKLVTANLKFLGIKENQDLNEVYPQLPVTIENNFSLAGISNQEKNKITLLFGFGNQVTQEKEIILNAEEQSTKDWDISQFWAQKKIAELEIFEDQNREEIKNLGKQFGIATNNTSLIVLENLQDYVRYEILPPLELREEYDRIVKNNRDQRDIRMNNLMEKAEKMTENLKKWWNTEFRNEKKYPKPLKPQTQNVIIRGNTSVNEALSGQVSGVEINNDSVVTRDISEVVIVGAMGISRNKTVFSEEPGNEKSAEKENIVKGKITTIDVKSDAEYMKSFEKMNSAENIYKEYLVQRKKYQETPGFYFDISKLLFQKNNKNLGLKVLSSISDLDIENEELYKLLIYKLKEQNITDKEVWIAKKILEWRPMDPQSYRDYALALEDDGKPQEALENIYKILNRSYTQELANRDNGIEETIIMELNEIISRNKNKLDISKINPKLIADLPVNIRVVLNWNKDNTDIDLWVTDPTGERCMYSNKKTAIGGRLSDDFTGGFGPEQFLLKKAIKGKYKIETNFYGENQVTLTGPTAILAEIYINYATGKQERKLVVFQNQKKSEEGNGDGVLIGEFEF